VRELADEGTGAARKLIAVVGVAAVREAVEACRAGRELRTDLDAAWLSVVLRDLRVRDDAWARMDPRHAAAHLRLWADLTRRARPGLVAAPATMLAFVAWQSGNGALANVALDRALADDDAYTMALLMRDVIDAGVPPDKALPPLSPEEVAESYAEGEDADADADDASDLGDLDDLDDIIGLDELGELADLDDPRDLSGPGDDGHGPGGGLVPPLDDGRAAGGPRLPGRIREPFARIGAMPCLGGAPRASRPDIAPRAMTAPQPRGRAT
jgi:hypothetical protein